MQKPTVLKKLESVLAKDERLISDGTLLKNKITELTLKRDKELVESIFSDDTLKKVFFYSVGENFVFDQDKFLQFINNKEFLPDSYTAFKNKIGLINDRGDFFHSKGKVELVWPYKDCVLEGGQTKEEVKRDEIFWNETLAPDQVTKLLDPKVLTNVKRIDDSGEKDTISFKFNEDGEIQDNLLVKGNNLLALSSIKARFLGKVKLIYIDPPYNKDSDSFKYNDRFNHSTWLTFMKNRLQIARELLSDEGIIFVHIGDEELHYLKILMDQIFERENFIATIPRKTRSGKSDVSWKLSQDFDWILIYTKKAPRQTHLFKRAIERKYHTSPDFPNDPWRLSDLTTQRTTEERRNSDFTLINPKNGQKFPVNPQRSWSVTKDTVDEYIQNGKIVFPGDYDFLDITVPAMRTFRSEEIARYGEDFDKTYVSSDFLNQAMDKLLGTDFYNKKGTDEIIELFGSKKFDYPKNELLMKKIIEFSTEEGDIVLDFFAGSGTTGAVAHKMNRQYILIEQMDYIEDITLERLKKVIKGDEVGVSEELGWKGGGELVYLELKAWNQLFIEEIVSAEDEELPGLLEKILKRAQLSYLVNKSNIDKKEFNKLEPENQRQLLIELLDKNQLYVNYSEIDDEEYGVSQEEKKISKQFYGDGE